MNIFCGWVAKQLQHTVNQTVIFEAQDNRASKHYPREFQVTINQVWGSKTPKSIHMQAMDYGTCRRVMGLSASLQQLIKECDV
jgi:hypothetical protein